MQESIYESAKHEENWKNFLARKAEKGHLSKTEEEALRAFIEKKQYLSCIRAWEAQNFPAHLPEKHIINKAASRKKRVVYSFSEEENLFLKFIAFHLYRFDSHLADNCYSFRQNYSVSCAVQDVKKIPRRGEMYTLKTDIHNYFNSMDIPLLLEKAAFLKEEDPMLHALFEKILTNEYVTERGRVIQENHGAMAGVPISPFFANLYLKDVDTYFRDRGIFYFRYSDDILLFADTEEKLTEYRNCLYEKIKDLKLEINFKKEKITHPGEAFEFLGFRFEKDCVDLSDHTFAEMKAKIKRKAHSLRRWQQRKGLSGDKAAIGFIRAMNYKFYGAEDEKEFSWNRWFFPNLTTDRRLRELDRHMQAYIRYCVTGRHYKGNYRIDYAQMKEWGYKSLVHAYYLHDDKKKKELE